MRPDGYVRLGELLQHRSLRGKQATVSEVEQIVATSDKQRFALMTDSETGERWVRANQGHTMKLVSDEALLTEVTDPADAPVCVHGTYRRCLAPILAEGLSRMRRNHVHFAVGLPDEDGGKGVVSGMRSSCEVVVYVDVSRALGLGLRFYRSENGVLLSPGDAAGRVPPACFAKVIERATGEAIAFTAPPYSPPAPPTPPAITSAAAAAAATAATASAAEAARAARQSRLCSKEDHILRHDQRQTKGHVVLVTHGSMNPVHRGHIDVRTRKASRTRGE